MSARKKPVVGTGRVLVRAAAGFDEGPITEIE